MARLNYYHYNFNAMGSPCSIQLYAKNSKSAKQAAKIVMDDVYRLETKYSRYRDDSLLSKINRIAAQGRSILVDDETSGLLDYASTCYQQSDGLFDITSGILRRAWNFKSGVIPDNLIIEKLLAQIGWHHLRWQKPKLTFTIAGMEIDFGGIVKEYAVDRAASLCVQNDIHHGVINLGGDIRIIGPHADESPWRVAIRHPNKPDGILTTVELYAGAVASSGDYERCITLNGKRYGHVLNPKTGWPVSYMVAVSVIGDFCVVAGSASTIAMLKEEQGTAWLKELGLPHLWVNLQGHHGGSIPIE
ncbi:MAG TPA: FAD:protein FMN transferase [Nitrosomonas sp.]|nr:FAD:protein FMN transferase [Nitrosomonas sp.]HQX13031.1 FAD:protein FMN transferase [Nitrosomonas sp.]HRB21750.1 FAD:protein FMN transferase [Nitrosomonas sp.]HRB32779.1 FAD:protein FMN transferase [Nitrosomonas sp.]HRB77281.1 FAD:protein FMN transferase [Nitrosomonas sp.]